MVCQPQTNMLRVISPAKMSLLEINKELYFGVCNHGKPWANPHQPEDNSFIEGKRRFRRVIVNKGSIEGTKSLKYRGLLSLYTHGLSFCQERRGAFASSSWAMLLCREWELLLLAPQLYFNWGFCLFNFTGPMKILHDRNWILVKSQTWT